MTVEAPAAAPSNPRHKWYIVHAYSNFEKKVKESILEQAKSQGLSDTFSDILVPTEDVVEIRRGRKVNAERKFFPGYVLVKMEMTDEAYHLIKNTPKVTGFLGSGSKPMPVSETENSVAPPMFSTSRRTSPASSCKSPSNCATVRSCPGSTSSGRISASGSSTKRRRCMRGCGSVSTGSSLTTSSAYSRSKSSVRGELRSRCSGLPSACSMACSTPRGFSRRFLFSSSSR